jgi:hypothetical protein
MDIMVEAKNRDFLCVKFQAEAAPGRMLVSTVEPHLAQL